MPDGRETDAFGNVNPKEFADNPKEWKTDTSRLELKTPVFSVNTECRCETETDENGKVSLTGKECRVSIIDAPDWVHVVPITKDGKVVLVRQHRHGSNESSLEFPGGVVDKGESVVLAGLRELKEETGYTPIDSVNYIAKIKPNPALFNNYSHILIAKDVELTHPTDFDEGEYLTTELYNVKSLTYLVRTGAIDHAIMIAVCHLFLTSPIYNQGSSLI